jgi:hypothetical protein
MNPGVIFSGIGVVCFTVIFMASVVGYIKVCDNEYLYPNPDRLREARRDKSLLMISSFTLILINAYTLLINL